MSGPRFHKFLRAQATAGRAVHRNWIPVRSSFSTQPGLHKKMFKWCPHDVQIKSKWRPNDIQMMSRLCPNGVKVESRWCPNDAQILCKWWPSDVQNNQIMTQWCSDDVQMMYKESPKKRSDSCPNCVQTKSKRWQIYVQTVHKQSPIDLKIKSKLCSNCMQMMLN